MFHDKNSRPLAVNNKNHDEMLISLTKYRNPNNTIRDDVAMIITANLQMFSPEIPAEQSLARVLQLTGNNEKN